MNQLKPPKNLRDIVPRYCATCHFFRIGNHMGCIREDESFWSNDSIEYFYLLICDYYKKEVSNESKR